MARSTKPNAVPTDVMRSAKVTDFGDQEPCVGKLASTQTTFHSPQLTLRCEERGRTVTYLNTLKPNKGLLRIRLESTRSELLQLL